MRSVIVGIKRAPLGDQVNNPNTSQQGAWVADWPHVPAEIDDGLAGVFAPEQRGSVFRPQWRYCEDGALLDPEDPCEAPAQDSSSEEGAPMAPA